STTESANGPSCIVLLGLPDDIQKVANQAQIGFMPNASAQLLADVHSITDKLATAPNDQQPFNWDVESFDLRTRTWVKGLQPNSACKFTPRYGVPKFLLHRRNSKFLQLPKRDAVYASALIQG